MTMLRSIPFVALLISCLAVLSCANDNVVHTATVQVESDDDIDFTQFQTFSVVTEDIVDAPDKLPALGEEQQAFNQRINELIIEAMEAEPVCLEYIPTDQTSPGNQPDLWAANGLVRSSDEGYVYDCCGGWWWGYWGWYWNSCAYLCPIYVEFEVGSLFIPVGLPPDQGEQPGAVFGGLVRSLVDSGTPTDEQLRTAVNAIFQQWPDKRQCPQ
jgi:hypothetical protein